MPLLDLGGSRASPEDTALAGNEGFAERYWSLDPVNAARKSATDERVTAAAISTKYETAIVFEVVQAEPLTMARSRVQTLSTWREASSQLTPCREYRFPVATTSGFEYEYDPTYLYTAREETALQITDIARDESDTPSMAAALATGRFGGVSAALYPGYDFARIIKWIGRRPGQEGMVTVSLSDYEVKKHELGVVREFVLRSTADTEASEVAAPASTLTSRPTDSLEHDIEAGPTEPK